MSFDFTGQTALVAGGTRGIGRAVSTAFLQAGASVIGLYRSNESAATAFRNELTEGADRLDIRPCDVSKLSEVESVFRALEDVGAKVQIMVNCSGIRSDKVLGMMKEEEWSQVLDTNLTGTFNLCKQAVQHMMRQRYGRIINITSPIGRIGFAGQANYAASKAGQVALTRSLSKEVASRKITVNCVSPGFIETDFIGDLTDEQRKGYLDMVPLKRFGTAEEVAHAVLFLAAKESAYITGTVLEVAGGI